MIPDQASLTPHRDRPRQYAVFLTPALVKHIDAAAKHAGALSRSQFIRLALTDYMVRRHRGLA
ncbi:MAG: ribbon-helix-helix protein, CopG family [Armatimonadetes bacterium]|nr:ribbon-helix-helix protein, CopG family [Armatimonadota bacterium]